MKGQFQQHCSHQTSPSHVQHHERVIQHEPVHADTWDTGLSRDRYPRASLDLLPHPNNDEESVSESNKCSWRGQFIHWLPGCLRC